MRDITLINSTGRYIGTVRTTLGSQPTQVKYKERLFNQCSMSSVLYREITSEKKDDCFVIPSRYYNK